MSTIAVAGMVICGVGALLVGGWALSALVKSFLGLSSNETRSTNQDAARAAMPPGAIAGDAETPGGESGVPADLRKSPPWADAQRIKDLACEMRRNETVYLRQYEEVAKQRDAALERAATTEAELRARGDSESWRAMHATIDRLQRDLAEARAPYHECLSLTYMSGDRAEEALLRIRKSLAGSVD